MSKINEWNAHGISSEEKKKRAGDKEKGFKIRFSSPSESSYKEDEREINHWKQHENIIIKFENGILINNVFYDYSVDENMELKAMIESGEMYRDILRCSKDDFIDVLVEERSTAYIEK
ncbi:hypothetical protein ENBRE01_2029 [Enteropsectra breve]|nr:hypothetical protein ENBRE01_2029 [Enteropsectra breve]